MTNADIQSIKEKVRALLMKAADGAASPAEAEGAMRAAQKLMAKYQVNEADLGSLTADSFKEVDRAGSKHPKKGWYLHPVDRYCAVIVGKFCGVKPWINTDDNGMALRLFGMESDVELANWMLGAFKAQFEADWERFKRFDMKTKRFADLTEARISFAQGFTGAVNDRLYGWLYRNSPDEGTGKTVGDGTSLVLKKTNLVEAEMERRGIRLGQARHTGRRGGDSMASGAGYNSGSAANVGRATAGAGSTIMIGG